MTEVDPQQFGEVKEAVKTLKSDVKELGKTLKSGLSQIHKRIDDHMNNEEEEQKEHGVRLQNIETSLLVWKTRWGMAIAILSCIGSFLGQLALKIALQGTSLANLQ